MVLPSATQRTLCVAACFPPSRLTTATFARGHVDSEPVFSFELPEIFFKLVRHCKGVDTSDVAVVLKLDDLPQVAFSLLPCDPVCKKQKRGIGPFGGGNDADIAYDVRHFRAGCRIRAAAFEGIAKSHFASLRGPLNVQRT